MKSLILSCTVFFSVISLGVTPSARAASTAVQWVGETADSVTPLPGNALGAPGKSTTALAANEPAQPMPLASFVLPQDGTPNNNGFIGPFCCTGRTVTVHRDGVPLGYIYFYSWEGQAYNVGPDHSVAPDLQILLSGLREVADPTSPQDQSAVSFLARELVPGTTRTAQAGGLYFTVTVLEVTLEALDQTPYFDMGAISVRIDVSLTAPTQTGVLENPRSGSVQSGLGMITGWACSATRLDVVIDERLTLSAVVDTVREDTSTVCGGTAQNGFGLFLNWNLLGAGLHTLRAFVDGVEIGRAEFTVVPLEGEFVRNIQGQCVVPDFPQPGQQTTLTWEEGLQNFVITAEH